MPTNQLHLHPTFKVYQQPDTVETFIRYLAAKRANPTPFHSGWYSQPCPEALSNRCLLWHASKLLCTKRGWKEEEFPDLKRVPPFQIKIPCHLTSTAKSQPEITYKKFCSLSTLQTSSVNLKINDIISLKMLISKITTVKYELDRVISIGILLFSCQTDNTECV